MQNYNLSFLELLVKHRRKAKQENAPVASILHYFCTIFNILLTPFFITLLKLTCIYSLKFVR